MRRQVDVLINNAAVQRAWKDPITAHNDRTCNLLMSALGLMEDPADAVEKLVWEGVDEWVRRMCVVLIMTSEDWNITNAGKSSGPLLSSPLD